MLIFKIYGLKLVADWYFCKDGAAQLILLSYLSRKIVFFLMPSIDSWPSKLFLHWKFSIGIEQLGHPSELGQNRKWRRLRPGRLGNIPLSYFILLPSPSLAGCSAIDRGELVFKFVKRQSHEVVALWFLCPNSDQQSQQTNLTSWKIP